MHLTDKQIVQIAKLLNIKLYKAWFLVTEKKELVSSYLFSSVYGIRYAVYFSCYSNKDREDVIKYGKYLQELLYGEFDLDINFLAIEGYMITKDDYGVGSKYDYGISKKESLNFPEDLHANPPVVFFSKEKAMSVLKRLIYYAAEKILVRGKWGGCFCKQEIKAIIKS